MILRDLFNTPAAYHVGLSAGPRRERSTGRKRRPWAMPKMQIPKNWMKKTRKTYEVEAPITTTATKVDIAPWKTAEPV
jgi:hypothetical protein